MAKLKFIKLGEELTPLPIYVEDITDSQGNSVLLILSNLNKVEVEYNEGTTIASVNGVPIKIPTDSIPIKGTKVFNSTLSLKTSSYGFTEGEIIYTKGYRTSNDGGATFFIIKSEQLETDDATYIQLLNGLYAEIMPPANGILNIYHFGGREYNMKQKDDYIFDNSLCILKFLNYCNKKLHCFTLYIPGGTWTISSIDITSTIGVKIIGESPTSGVETSCTKIVPLEELNYDYLLKLSGPWFDIRNLHFGKPSFKSAYGSGAAWWADVPDLGTTKKEIILDGVTDSYFDGIYISYGNTLFDINNTTNCYFGLINIRDSGSLTYRTMMFGDNISGLYFDYFNLECITGSAFYGYGNSMCQFVINNILMEGTAPMKGTDPGYNHQGLHYFVFEGHLGSELYPCILNNFSVTNLGSYTLNYKCMGFIGHETDVELGMIIGNFFLNTKSGSNTWLLYDTSGTSNAFVTVNQPILATSQYFYLKNANPPLINTTLKRFGIIGVLDTEPKKVSYLNGAYSAHSLVGTNDSDEPYTLTVLPGKRLGFRFYNEEGISLVSVQVKKETTIGNYQDYIVYQLPCSSDIGWTTVVIPDMEFTVPTKVLLYYLPKNIDYFADYE